MFVEDDEDDQGKAKKAKLLDKAALGAVSGGKEEIARAWLLVSSKAPADRYV